MTSKSQDEQEQPAKVYQLDALSNKMDGMKEQLNTILRQTAGLATVAQLEAVKTNFKEKLDDAIKDVHAEYSPTLKRNKALWTLVGGLVFTIVAQAVILILFRS